MPSLTREIKNSDPIARRICQEVQIRVRQWEKATATKRGKWKDAEEKALAYLPEGEIDAARRTQREGGSPQYTTIQVPYSYAVVMAAHTYLTSVFMGRDPVFQYTGRHGESQQQIQAIEALVAYQVQNGRFLPYLYTWLYDALKYGVGIVELNWEEKIEIVTTILEVPDEVDPMTGQPVTFKKQQQSQPYRSYAGNTVANVQPQSFIWDTRYTMREFQKGEFCGRKKKVGWNEATRQAAMGYYMNLEFVGKSGRSGLGDDGSAQLDRPESESSSFSSSDLDAVGGKRPSMFEVYRMVMEIIPHEYGLSDSKWPEKWVFTVTSDYSVLVGCQPLGAFHCKFPFGVIPLEPEGYGLTTRGLPEVLEPIQNTVDWLINSHFYNVRAALNNQFVVDPSRVVMKDLLDPLPGGIIRLRPEAYGSNTRDVVTQLPVADMTRTHVGDLSTMFGIGERAGGVNDQIMGMLSGGGRKTATEVRTSTSFGINRLKTTAEFASACGFDPLSQMIVQNSQQYFDMELKLRIAGDLALSAGQGFLQVTPDTIIGNYDFVPVDGTLPIDRQGQVALWQTMMREAAAIPQIGMQYDWGGIFQWVAQLAGLKNITQFKIQVQPDMLLAQQAAAGNVVPMKGGGLDGKAPGAQFAPGMSAGPGA